VSLMPACAIDGWQGRIAFPRLKEQPRIPVTMIWRADNTSPVLGTFREVLLSRGDFPYFPAIGLRSRSGGRTHGKAGRDAAGR
jgi:hypothetical protein